MTSERGRVDDKDIVLLTVYFAWSPNQFNFIQK